MVTFGGFRGKASNVKRVTVHKEALKKAGAAYTKTNTLHMESVIIECSEQLFQKLSGFADAKEK